MLCGQGEIQPNGDTALDATCSLDQPLALVVAMGSADVFTPAGTRFVVTANHRFAFDIKNPAASKTTVVRMTPSQMAVFKAQAHVLGIPFRPGINAVLTTTTTTASTSTTASGG